VAEGLLPASWPAGKPETGEEQKTTEATSTEGTEKPPESQGTPSQPISERIEEFGKRTEDYFTKTRAGRIAGYSAAIFFNVVFLIFFSFFHRYIAWYHLEPDGGITRLPLLTGAYFTWLPVLVTALAISIAANIVLIIYDRYWLRETIHIILASIGAAVVAELIAIFPFNFSVIPDPTAADIMPVAVTIGLVIIAVGLGIGALVRLIKLLVGIAQ
jgi:magnesium-transporting ATPase (P-type)